MSVKELFTCGNANVGRDIIGTMANTLILVYLGGSLPFILMLASNIDLQKFLNLNQVVGRNIISSYRKYCNVKYAYLLQQLLL